MNQAEAVDIPPKGSIKIVEDTDLSWTKSLNQIEKHRQLTGKAKGKGLPITKAFVKAVAAQLFMGPLGHICCWGPNGALGVW